ncbi:hypothetical protein [uncultured Cardiobacterium sp.]|uniref:hypothetical protein n=1 Tax=uncultured Cardiobacterium sp. TaxID=417619 RepID=UPI0026213266|nr:hypothetical protein [uncultured Cardiobacterium sp.]
MAAFPAAGWTAKPPTVGSFLLLFLPIPLFFDDMIFFAVPTVGVLTFITDHAGWFSMLLLYPLWRRLAALAWIMIREWLRPTRTIVIRHWRGKPLPQPVVLDLSSKEPLVSQLKKIRQEED